jgi:formamidopyrimidine-DNA glycosylase
MPELPEVETVARQLRPHLVGRRLGAVHVSWPRTLGDITPRRFAAAVRGTRVHSVGRRAKFVLIDLARGRQAVGRLLVHLRMTGRLSVERAGSDPGRWERLSIELDGRRELRFVDPRKFGRVLFRAGPARELDSLGPEPLEADFDLASFAAALAARRRQLKPLLLDQTFVAGLGNIYVDESLHRAGLHPLVLSDRLAAPAVERLHEAIRSVLAEAIEREGSSFDVFYRTPEGQPGSYQDRFQVYGRDGQPCRTCGATIQALRVGQRGTHVCPRCQPRRGAGVRRKRPSATSRGQ